MEKGFTRCRLDRPWTEAVTLLPEGFDLLLRPIQPADSRQLRESFTLLTPEDVRFRFLHMVTELTPGAARELARIDPAREFALVVTEPGPPGKAAIGAVARAVIPEATRESEFSIIVGRPFRGHGLAAHLVRKLIEWSRKKRLESIYGDVLADNAAMLDLARHLGFERHPHPGEPAVMRVRLRLRNRTKHE